VGSYSASSGASACTPCAQGTYSWGAGAHTCIQVQRRATAAGTIIYSFRQKRTAAT
jgi:hypothetical protein